jgi:hypothetical protein
MRVFEKESQVRQRTEESNQRIWATLCCICEGSQFYCLPSWLASNPVSNPEFYGSHQRSGSPKSSEMFRRCEFGRT